MTVPMMGLTRVRGTKGMRFISTSCVPNFKALANTDNTIVVIVSSGSVLNV